MKKEFVFLSQAQREAGMEESDFKQNVHVPRGYLSKCALCKKKTFGFTCPSCTKKLKAGYGLRKRKLKKMV